MYFCVKNKVQEEAARQQVPHGGAGSFGKGNTMAPPGIMQRHHLNVVSNQNNGMVGAVGNVSGVNNLGQIGGQNSSNNMMGSNLLPLDQWGGNRYSNTINQGLRQPNQNSNMQQNQVQQQVSVLSIYKYL